MIVRATSEPSRARVTATIGRSVAWEPESGLVSTTTNAKGRYRLDGLAKGQVAVSARAPGYAGSRQSSVRAGGTADFDLLPGASLTGLVLGPDGQPIANAVVLAESDAGPAPPAHLPLTAQSCPPVPAHPDDQRQEEGRPQQRGYNANRQGPALRREPNR